ncbi:MAG: hypothetical protein JNM82_03750 [Rhodocyclaceae bacterium]|nr:hypothetical protein [Rhodocyclaceae bacterium]
MARETFRGTVPRDRLYDPDQDMWVAGDGEGVTVGATAFGLFLAGEIIGFTGKPRGGAVERHRGLGTVECAKTVLAVRSPLSLENLEANEAAEEMPGMINGAPYGAGWLARGRPTAWDAERALLVDAAAYRARILAIEPGAEILDGDDRPEWP